MPTRTNVKVVGQGQNSKAFVKYYALAPLFIIVNSMRAYFRNITSRGLTRHCGGTQMVTTLHISPAIPAHPHRWVGGGGQWLQMTGALVYMSPNGLRHDLITRVDAWVILKTEKWTPMLKKAKHKTLFSI